MAKDRNTGRESAPSLFDVASERIAYEGAMRGDDKPLSQVKSELRYGRPETIAQKCEQCGTVFIATLRSPMVCNLCRSGYQFCKVCGMMLPLHSSYCPQYKKQRARS